MSNAGLATAPATVELVLPARPESVALARLALAGVAAVAGATDAEAADLKLAASELCTSVVRALDGGEAEPMVVRYRTADGVFTLEVEHAGVVLDAARLDPAANGDPAGAALGLAVARAVTDSLWIESGGPGTRIVGSKRLARGEG